MAMDIDNKKLEQDIENALRARGLKEQMLQWDSEVRGERLKARDERLKIRRVIYTLTAAAAVVAILIVTVPVSTWQSTYRQVYQWGYQQYAHYILKQPQHQATQYLYSTEQLLAKAEASVGAIAEGRYEQEILGHEDLLQEASWQILTGHYQIALTILEEKKELLNESDAFCQDTIDDIAYLEALCYLGMGQRDKAHEALTSIAGSNSKHQENATMLVREMEMSK